MVRKKIWASSVGILLLGIVIILTIRGANAEEEPDNKCLIIVSDLFTTTWHENGKAQSFYDYCIDSSTYQEEDITFLGDPSIPHSDGPATISNVEAGFQWLRTVCDPDTEAIIYIADHQRIIAGIINFTFSDGNISTDLIGSWIGEIQASKITIILNGERSALAGPDLSSPGRTIICSMGSNLEYDPDIFNITRSLEDPTADTNMDGKVSFVEAYWKEVDNLSGTGQDPVLFQGT